MEDPLLRVLYLVYVEVIQLRICIYHHVTPGPSRLKKSQVVMRVVVVVGVVMEAMRTHPSPMKLDFESTILCKSRPAHKKCSNGTGRIGVEMT